MSYKIAAASSDGKQIDETFGSAKKFIIYEVTDGRYQKLEERVFHEEGTVDNPGAVAEGCHPSVSGRQEDRCGIPGGCGCDAKGGCGSGTKGGCGSGTQGGCGGAGEASKKVELVSDCRCVVCKKIGFHIQKQLERKAISAFDVTCPVEEALEKISYYFTRIDNHESLRVQK